MKYEKIIYFLFVVLFLFMISGVNATDIDLKFDISDNAGEVIDYTSSGIIDYNLNDSSLKESGSDAKNIYFDASASKDGDGSSSNPYKILTNARLKAGYTAYFKDGIYTLNNYKSISSSSTITLIGESSENTIIRYGGIAFVINGGSTLSLKKLTLSNAIVKNGGTLTGTDTIFRDGIAVFNESGIDYGNTEGGAIYAIGSSPKTTLTNCDFINNSAAYGGAIFVDSGTLTISNCNFINNTAKNYGGSIAALDGSSLTVTNSRFINSTSLGDTGGAVYTQESILKSTNCDFINNYAHFGGVICSLKSTLTVTESNFFNNTAKYEAGAIYKMYGTVSITDSNFTSNSALSGGALYLDNCTSTIKTSKFYNNNAINYAGAIFANFVTVATSTDIFDGNSAKAYDDVYNQNSHIYEIGSSNYQMFVNNYTFKGSIPSKYNLVDEGYVSAIRDQEDGGNCWSFAAIAALESCVLKASNYTYDFSEENLKNLMEYYSEYGWKRETNEGGFDEMAIGYLTSWLGPVLEEDDIYDDHSTISTVLNSVIHVQNIVYLPVRTSFTDLTSLKKAIMTYGAVAVGIYYDSTYYNKQYASYYYKGIYSSSTGNHAVTIVGWDDNYDKSKFKNTPSGNGAFIVKNSWNTDWGDNGYFYVSYYDPVVYKVNYKHAAYTFLLNDTIRFNKNYQYDISGPTDFYDTGEKTIYIKNIFKSTGEDSLAAVSTYFDVTLSYTVSIYVNNALKLTQSGSAGPGYYTINLNKLIPLKNGDEFDVVFKLVGSKDVSIAICEKSTITRVFASTGLSYISTDGSSWKDLYGYKEHWWSFTRSYQVACIKAFTTANIIPTQIKINNTVLAVDSEGILLASISDNDGNPIASGNAIFTINDVGYNRTISNGIANLTIGFDKVGNYTVYVSYNGDNMYDASQSYGEITVIKKAISTIIDADNIYYGEDLIINITLSEKLNGTLQVSIAQKRENVVITNGKGQLKVSNLTVGKYSILSIFAEDEKYNSSVVSKSVEVLTIDNRLTSKISLNISDIAYGDKPIVEVNLLGVDNEKISIIINSKSYEITIINGSGLKQIDDILDAGSYNATASFNGNNDYLNTSFTTTFKVNKAKSQVSISTSDIVFGQDATINISLNVDGVVKVIIDSAVENIKIVNGKANITKSGLNVGNHNIEVIFEGNGNYLNSSNTSSFKVSREYLNLSIDANDITYGEDLLIKADISIKQKVNITFLINNIIRIVESSDGHCEFSVSNLDAGNYTVIGNYIGLNDKISSKTMASVGKAKSTLTVETSDIKAGENEIINISLNVDGVVKVIIDSAVENIKIVNGEASIIKDNLTAGNYNVEVIFEGNNNYLSTKAFKTFNVAKIDDYEIKLSDIKIFEGQDAIIEIALNDLYGDIICNVDGKNYVGSIKNGKAIFAISNLTEGNYSYTVTYPENNKYLEKSASATIAVESNKTAIIISRDLEKYFSSSDRFEITLTDKDSNPIKNATVYLTLNNVSYKRFTDGEGKTSIAINLNSGKYSIVAKFEGDENYNPVSANNNITVKSTVIGQDLTKIFRNSSQYYATFVDLNGNLIRNNSVEFNINGVFYKRNIDENGTAQMNINLEQGSYIITSKNPLTGEMYTNLITVLPRIVETQDMEMFYRNGSRYTVKLIGDDGNPVADENVSFNINGVLYTRTSDSNGYVSLNINLNPDNYIITSEYKGCRVSNKISVKPILSAKDMSMKFRDGSRFNVNVVDGVGNPLKEADLTFNINGVFYNRTSDENGTASLNINLQKGQYIITSIYNTASISNKITIF